MIRIAGNTSARSPLVMSIVEDPTQCAEHTRIRDIFQRNYEWYRRHQEQIAGINVGQCVCIAGQTLFVAPTAREVLDLARQAHPEEDGGYYFFYVRPDRERPTPRNFHADFGAVD